MRVSVAVATADAPPSAFVVWRGLEESMRKAAEYGYDGVELALADAGQVDQDRLAELCCRYGIEISAISTGQVFAVHNLYLTQPDPALLEQTIQCLKGLVDAASRFGRKLNLGRARGKLAETGNSSEEAAIRFTESIRTLAAYAAQMNVELLLEPINRYETNFINRLEEGAALIDQLAMPNIKLMPDLFHMNIEEPSILGELVRYFRYLSYIHVADSNRQAPGQGHLDFQKIFATLDSSGYTGWVTVEILPYPAPDQAARAAIDYLRQIIK